MTELEAREKRSLKTTGQRLGLVFDAFTILPFAALLTFIRFPGLEEPRVSARQDLKT